MVVEVADSVRDQVTVNILRDGERAIDGWTVTSDDNTRRIRTGRISVDVDGELSDEIEISFVRNETQLKRNGKVVVSIAPKASTSMANELPVESDNADLPPIPLSWNPDEFASAGPDQFAEPPTLDEWLVGKEIVTVAQDGTGDFQSIYAATRPNVVMPNQVIEVLDKGPYVETLELSRLPPDCGLFSRVGTVIVVADWKPLPNPAKEYTQFQAHVVSRTPGFRLSGFRFHFDRRSFGLPLQFFALGSGVLENCIFIGTGQHGPEEHPDEVRVYLSFREGFSPSEGEVMPRFWVRDNVFLSSLRLASRVELPVEFYVTRNLLIGHDYQYRLYLRADGPVKSDPEGMRCIVQQNVFDCRSNGQAIGFSSDRVPSDDAQRSGVIVLDKNTFRSNRPEGLVQIVTAVPLNQLTFTRNLLDGNQNAWLEAVFPYWESVAFNCVPVAHASAPVSSGLVLRNPLPHSDERNPDYMRPATDSAVGIALQTIPEIVYVGALPFHSEVRPRDWFDALRELLVEQQTLQTRIAAEHHWKTGKR